MHPRCLADPECAASRAAPNGAALKLLALTAALALAVCPSCTVLSVHRAEKSLAGVPFYVRSGVCRHEVVWLEPVYTLTLESVTTENGKESVKAVGVAEFSLSEFKASQADIASLKTAVVNGGNVLSMWTVIQSAHAYNPLANAAPAAENVVLVSNVNKLETTVDYRDRYYINTRRPILGSAKSDVKLATDGTLTEGSGEVESKTLQSFLDLLPVKALISKAAGLAEKGGGPPAPPYRLQVESRAVKHTFQRFTALSDKAGETQCPALPAVSFGDANYNHERADASTETTAKDGKSDLKVSGEIAVQPKDGKQDRQ